MTIEDPGNIRRLREAYDRAWTECNKQRRRAEIAEAALAARPIEAGSVVERLRRAANDWGVPVCDVAADLIQNQAAAIAEQEEAYNAVMAEGMAHLARAERLEEVVQNALAAGLPEEVAISARAALQQEASACSALG